MPDNKNQGQNQNKQQPGQPGQGGEKRSSEIEKDDRRQMGNQGDRDRNIEGGDVTRTGQQGGTDGDQDRNRNR